MGYASYIGGLLTSPSASSSGSPSPSYRSHFDPQLFPRPDASRLGSRHLLQDELSSDHDGESLTAILP